jgi:PKD repeat protein
MFFGQSTDAGSDNLTFTWIWGDGTQTINTHPNEESSYPFTQTDQTGHIYTNPGKYTINLIVEDDDGGSVSTTYEITVLSAEEAKHAINNYIQALDDNEFKNSPNQRKIALNKIFFSADKMLNKEKYNEAIYQLENIRKRIDGSVDGTPMNDWITHPNSQEHICAMIDALVSYIKIL